MDREHGDKRISLELLTATLMESPVEVQIAVCGHLPFAQIAVLGRSECAAGKIIRENINTIIYKAGRMFSRCSQYSDFWRATLLATRSQHLEYLAVLEEVRSLMSLLHPRQTAEHEGIDNGVGASNTVTQGTITVELSRIRSLARETGVLITEYIDMVAAAGLDKVAFGKWALADLHVLAD